MKKSETMVFKSRIFSDTLTINGNEIKVTNKFGDTYTGRLDENGKINTKSRLGFGYLVRAMQEYRGEISAVK